MKKKPKYYVKSRAETKIIEIKHEIINGQMVEVKVYAPASAINPMRIENKWISNGSGVQPLGGIGSTLLGSSNKALPGLTKPTKKS